MTALNKVTLQGWVGSNDTIRKDGSSISFTLNTPDAHLTKDNYHNIRVWDGLAKRISESVKPGSMLLIVGSLHYRKSNSGRVWADIHVRENSGGTVEVISTNNKVENN